MQHGGARNLTYAYDVDGRRIQMGGRLAYRRAAKQQDDRKLSYNFAYDGLNEAPEQELYAAYFMAFAHHVFLSGFEMYPTLGCLFVQARLLLNVL